MTLDVILKYCMVNIIARHFYTLIVPHIDVSYLEMTQLHIKNC